MPCILGLSMRVFSKILLIILLLISMGYLAQSIRARREERISTEFPSEEETRVLILGDSHAVAGIDPQYIPFSANWAQVGEELEFSYYKLLHALRVGLKPKDLILTCSFFNFLAPKDSQSEMMKRYHPLLDKDFYKAKFAFQEADASVYYYYLTNIIMPDYIPVGILNDFVLLHGPLDYYGAYDRREGSAIGDLRSLHKAIQRHYFVGKELRDFSPLRVHYFNEFITLCRDQDIRLWVVNTPLNDQYIERVPTEISSQYYQIIANRKHDFKFLDYSHISLPDSMFFDYDHLNYNGAQIFSEVIASGLQEP